jgi:hypothetical protein
MSACISVGPVSADGRMQGLTGVRVPFLLQNMGIEYDEAMETIHVIKRDGSVSLWSHVEDSARRRLV